MGRSVPPLVICALVWAPPDAHAQGAVDAYLTAPLRVSAETVAKSRPEDRTQSQILGLLPLRNPGSFVQFLKAEQRPAAEALRGVLGEVDAARLNKIVAGGPGAGTALVSGVAAPAVLGAAVEFGSILEETSGTVTTLRGNLLGVAQLLFGVEQFPSCPALSEAMCGRGPRWLHAVSGSVSFEAASTSGATGTAAPAGTVNLSGDGHRVVSWSARLDLTRSNQLDDPAYVRAWAGAVEELATSPEAAEVTRAIEAAFSESVGEDDSLYPVWQAGTVGLLMQASEGEFLSVLEARLALLVALLEASDPAFAANMGALARAHANYELLRGRLLREAQVHKLSFEYTNRRPADHLFWSNARLIYSHQPTEAPAILTLNAAVSWYHRLPSGSSGGRLRDVQAAAQVDRRLGTVPSFGQAVLTLAAYYQWMKDDALLEIPSGTQVPGTGIDLPGEAPTLLGTKGHLGVVQAKVSLTMSEAVRVPLSVTWATDTSLIKDDVRGQLGLTLDLDQLFH